MAADKPHLKKLEVNGAELHYVEQGERERGDSVLFVHGGLSDYRTWRPQMGPFAARYHVVAYSRRGHYPNAWPDGYSQVSLQQHVDDLAALVERLGLGRTHIVANSYGCYISLVFALQHPERVRAMALAEPPLHPLLKRIPGGEALFEAFMESAWRPAGRVFAQGDMEGGVRLFVEGAVGKGEYERLPPKVREAMMKNAPDLQAATATEFSVHMPDFTCEDASKITAPTLLMRGGNSPKKYYLINDELARCMPNAEQALIPDAAHVLHNHNPEEHNLVVLEFLGRGEG